MERENLKLRGDAVQAKSKEAQNDQVRQLIAEKDQLMHELRFAKQDLISSKEESKRLRTSVDDASADVKAMKSEVAQTKAALASAQSAAAVAPPAAALHLRVSCPHHREGWPCSGDKMSSCRSWPD